MASCSVCRQEMTDPATTTCRGNDRLREAALMEWRDAALQRGAE